MKQSYNKFCQQLSSASIQELNLALKPKGSTAITQQSTQSPHLFRDKKLKDSPWLHHNKQSFDNQQNCYLRLIDLLGAFIRSEEKNFLKYARGCPEFDHLANKAQQLRKQSPEFQMLAYLLARNSRKLISVYVRLRKQILTRCGLNTAKYSPVSLHNQARNFKAEPLQLEHITVDYLDWAVLAELTRSPLEEDLLWWVSRGERTVPAVDFLRVCLWAHAGETGGLEGQA